MPFVTLLEVHDGKVTSREYSIPDRDWTAMDLDGDGLVRLREQEGTVLRVLADSDRVVVEGVAMRKRHQRPTQENPEGGIMTFEAPIHLSNVMLIDPATGDASRVRRR